MKEQKWIKYKTNGYTVQVRILYFNKFIKYIINENFTSFFYDNR